MLARKSARMHARTHVRTHARTNATRIRRVSPLDEREGEEEIIYPGNCSTYLHHPIPKMTHLALLIAAKTKTDQPRQILDLHELTGTISWHCD